MTRRSTLSDRLSGRGIARRNSHDGMSTSRSDDRRDPETSRDESAERSESCSHEKERPPSSRPGSRAARTPDRLRAGGGAATPPSAQWMC